MAGIASGAASSRTIQILDNCDGPTFNAVLGDGACVRNGGMAFEKFIGKLVRKGTVASWRFAPERLKLANGGTITAKNRGGEFHTFTEVAAYGGGCVDELNAILGLAPVPECADPSLFGTTGVAPGARLQTAPLSSGTHFFMCLIHPWQRTTVQVQ
jgi:hypothetical protein